jgi:hypothetical protein
MSSKGVAPPIDASYAQQLSETATSAVRIDRR